MEVTKHVWLFRTVHSPKSSGSEGGDNSLGKGLRRASYDHRHVQLSAQLWEGRFWDVNVLLFDFQGHM